MNSDDDSVFTAEERAKMREFAKRRARGETYAVRRLSDTPMNQSPDEEGSE